MIYFIQAELIGRIKIGFTRKPDLGPRLCELQTASPVKLQILAAIPGDKLTEKELHERFHHCRVQGEWFDPSPELVRFIAEQRAQHPIRPPVPRKPCPEAAEAFLVAAFGQQTSWSSNELLLKAREQGIHRDTLFKAKQNLPAIRAVKKSSRPGRQAWFWEWCGEGAAPTPSFGFAADLQHE
jgi:hypothetical protein